MKNPFVISICEHIEHVFEKNNLYINKNVLENKFTHFLMNESLCDRFSYFIDKIYAKTITESELIGFVNTAVMSSLNEGFENPFREEGYVANDEFIEVHQNKNLIDKDLYSIKGLKLYDPKVTQNLYHDKVNHKMYAGRPFIKGDIIEECGVFPVNVTDLYSKAMRDLTFAVPYDPNKDVVPLEFKDSIDPTNNVVYCYPMGYANYYRTTDNPDEANIDYDFEFNNEKSLISIYTLRRVKAGEELVLLSDRFMN